MTASKAAVRGLKTDLELYYRMLQHENVQHRHLARTHERERAMEHIRAQTAAKNAFIQHATLVEATRRMAPALAKFYHGKIKELLPNHTCFSQLDQLWHVLAILLVFDGKNLQLRRV